MRRRPCPAFAASAHNHWVQAGGRIDKGSLRLLPEGAPLNSYRESIKITTAHKVEVLDITMEVSRILAASGIQEGILLLFPHHTSAAVYVSDSDRNLTEDVTALMDRLIPEGDYRHDLSDEKKNARAHLKSLISGHNLTLPVSDGSLDLGVYQRVYYAEFDGQREKEILVKVIGDRIHRTE